MGSSDHDGEQKEWSEKKKNTWSNYQANEIYSTSAKVKG